MADKKISELSAYTPAVDVDLVPIVDTTTGVTKHITWANIKATLKTYFDSLTTTLTNKTLTSPVLTTPQLNDTSADHQYITAVSELTADRTVTMPLLTGNDEFVFKDHAQTLTNKTLSTGSKLDANADSNFTYNSLSRQAIINGNFDVWQRGTSFAGLTSDNFYIADKWVLNPSGGTLTISRQTHTLGQTDVPGNPKYYLRFEITSANDNCGIFQRIEGVGNFAGQNATVSFYAKAATAGNVRISLQQNFGTGGSPSATVSNIGAASIPVTTSWSKITLTIAVTSISGKTLGTAGNDYLALFIVDPANETNTIDISEVQLCAGDVALPFMPKSFEEELRACQRYCYVISSQLAGERVAFGSCATTTAAIVNIKSPSEFRVIPTLTATATDWKLNDLTAGIDLTEIALSSSTGKQNVAILCTVASGLTQFRPVFLVDDGTTGRLLILSAEL